MSVRSCLVNFKVIGLHFPQTVPPNMNCFKGFAYAISFLFYMFQIYVHLFFWNMLLQILLIEPIFYKKTD